MMISMSLLQMQSSFLLQGLNMDLRLGSFEIPAASLSLIDAMIILLLIPFMDRIVYPLLQRCNITLTPLRRIGTGMVFATLSVIAAAVTEAYRRDHVEGKLINDFSGKTYNASSISVFCQVPQYLLIGTSEVFASISGTKCTIICQILQSISWILAEFYFNRGLQRLYTGTCIILQKTINWFLCLLIVFLKSKTYQLILKDVTKLNRNLR